jgi:hypothetical protein
MIFTLYDKKYQAMLEEAAKTTKDVSIEVVNAGQMVPAYVWDSPNLSGELNKSTRLYYSSNPIAKDKVGIIIRHKEDDLGEFWEMVKHIIVRESL